MFDTDKPSCGIRGRTSAIRRPQRSPTTESTTECAVSTENASHTPSHELHSSLCPSICVENSSSKTGRRLSSSKSSKYTTHGRSRHAYRMAYSMSPPMYLLESMVTMSTQQDMHADFVAVRFPLPRFPMRQKCRDVSRPTPALYASTTTVGFTTMFHSSCIRVLLFFPEKQKTLEISSIPFMSGSISHKSGRMHIVVPVRPSGHIRLVA